MKRLLLAGLLLVSMNGYGQQILKRADAIEIRAAVSDSTLLNTTVDVFEDMGYVVLRSDMARGTVVSDQRSIGYITLRMLGDIKGGVLRLRGQWSGAAMGITFTNEVAMNAGTSAEKKSFAEVDKVAKKIVSQMQGASLTYTASGR